MYSGASFKSSPINLHFIEMNSCQNRFSVLSGNPSVHKISLPLSQLLGLPPHTSPYLWYWIDVANV